LLSIPKRNANIGGFFCSQNPFLKKIFEAVESREQESRIKMKRGLNKNTFASLSIPAFLTLIILILASYFLESYLLDSCHLDS
jgi:hypothetical protein